ncbi:DUF3052 domain-containing protein [Nocardia stercoris]|uniref:DUF3052 domain-containing protein n=1 Tax=Nocardia stercoris TaxID=2483361 RepID=A0A3M2LH35_9NOCA|nr:DUF3052 domain-containing protein [Nocardia stercoris]RMI35295.1 DUF3052 domain-containing protein [Nocardia stercoris]
MAGYSGTPLARKLGITDGSRVLLANPPAGFDLGPLPDAVTVHRRAGRDPYDVVVGFCPDTATLTGSFDRWRSVLTESGGLWIGRPKASAGIATDLTERFVREFGLAAGLVDNKVAALDEVWSGLRFVVRRADRAR